MDDPEDSKSRPYALRQYSSFRQMKSGLPNIPGVFALSKTEIKKDVREMERNFNEETDSDSSILSEDVLVSSYPVKPRKTPKVMIPVKPLNTGPTDVEREYDGKTVDQTLSFLDAVRRCKKDLYTAECERERLEDQNMSYRLSIDDTSKRYRQVKQDECNYFRVIQGFHTQALRFQMGLNRQNAMLYDVLIALQRRKDAANSIANETIKLKKTLAANRDVLISSTAATYEETAQKNVLLETAVLVVDFKKSGGQITLFKDQWITTPMGDGMILSIQPNADKVVIQLPFGKLYANLKRVVCWGRNGASPQVLELSGDVVLCHKWNALQETFSMKPEVARGIRELVGQGDDEAVTDKDDDNSNDDFSPTDNVIEDQNSNGGVSNGVLSNGHAERDRCDGQSDIPTSLLSSVLNGADNASSLSSMPSFPLKGYARSSASAVPVIGGGPLSRQSLRIVCSNNVSSETALNQHREASSTLPLVFASPAALPHMIEKSQATEVSEVRYCQHALSGGGQIGTVGSLAWEGDTIEMSRELLTLQEEINKLENEQNHYIGQIQSVRSRCAQLSTDTSGLRLAVFTRRVRHRNNMNTHMLSNPMHTMTSSTLPNAYANIPTAESCAENLSIGITVPANTLRSSRGNGVPVKDEPGLLGSSRSSTRLVNSLPAGAPGSNSPSPEGLEKGGAGTGSDLVGDSNAAFGASRKRGREPTPTAEIITSSRRRNVPNSSLNDTDYDPKEMRKNGAPSSSAGMEEDEEEEEERIKEEVGSQDLDEEENEVELAPTGAAFGRGGARVAGGFGAKKKPRKQRRV